MRQIDDHKVKPYFFFSFLNLVFLCKDSFYVSPRAGNA